MAGGTAVRYPGGLSLVVPTTALRVMGGGGGRVFPEATCCVHDIISTVYTVNLIMAVGADLGQ